MNKLRLKNHFNDKRDSFGALRTLYTVLFGLSKLMAPFAPFFSEYTYRVLAPIENLTDKSLASVHFSRIPTVKEINHVVLEKVGYLQQVTTLGRLSRERRNLSLRYPLKSVHVVHKDPKVLEYVLELQEYILLELNVKKITVSTDGKEWGSYSLKLNSKLLGPKYGKEFGNIKEKLVGSKRTKGIENPDNYIDDTSETFKFEEIELNKGEFSLVFNFTCEIDSYEGSSDENFMVVLDLTKDPELELDGQARTIANKIQKLRKDLHLQITDDITIYLDFFDEVNVKKAFELRRSDVESIVRKQIRDDIVAPVGDCLLGSFTDNELCITICKN